MLAVRGTDCSLSAKWGGQLSGPGAVDIQPFGFHFFMQPGTHRVYLVGEGANFDLRIFYATEQNPNTWTLVAQSVTKSSNEFVTFRGEEGLYRAEVTSVKGSGAYEVWWQRPDDQFDEFGP